MNTQTVLGSLVVAVLGLAASGCSSSTQTGAATPTQERATAAQKGSVVHVDDAIARACHLPTPRFDFDSSSVRGVADTRLDAVAQCFTSGPLAGRAVRLVGHADPRGETEYNFALGQRRAGSVALYIEHHGVRTSQVEATSRGELDATGTDEPGWAQDRRVDVVLAN